MHPGGDRCPGTAGRRARASRSAEPIDWRLPRRSSARDRGGDRDGHRASGPAASRRAANGLASAVGVVHDAQPAGGAHPWNASRSSVPTRSSRLPSSGSGLSVGSRKRSHRMSRAPRSIRSARCSPFGPMRRASPTRSPVTARIGSTWPGPNGASRAISSASDQPRCVGRQHQIDGHPARGLDRRRRVRRVRPRQRGEGTRERVPAGRRNAEAACAGVPAALDQQRRAGLQRSRGMEVLRRSYRPTQLFTPHGRRHRDRPSEAIRQAAGNQPHDARRPCLVAQRDWPVTSQRAGLLQAPPARLRRSAHVARC